MEGVKMTNKEAKHMVIKYFANEYLCDPEDFYDNKNKAIINDSSFFSMICFGNAAVAKVDKNIFEWCKDFLSKYTGFRCFDGIEMIEVYKKLIQYDFSVFFGQGALPDLSAKRSNINSDFCIRIFENSDISRFLLNEFDKAQWNMVNPGEGSDIVVATYYQNKLVGISSSCKCTDTISDIDIEVLPEFRVKGIATTLTSIITNLLIDRNIVPFTITAWSNIASRNVLYQCGYYPAWAQMDSVGMEWATKVINGEAE
jgi:FR47-like protein.